MNNKICVVTSTRADYSLLKPLIQLFYQNKNIELQLIVTGSHLCENLGNTFQAIENDGFEIRAKIPIISRDSKTGIAEAMAAACAGFGKAFEKLKPDILILLGDRYEIFTVAGIATVFNIPIAHIHGGETTFGAIDDVFRNSITQMSKFHFAAAEEYKRKIIQMTGNSRNVYFTGSLAVDSVKSINLISKDELEAQLGLSLENSILFTFHPETISSLSVEEQAHRVFSAMDRLEGFNIIMTKANADSGGSFINIRIDQFVQEHPGTSISRESLGQLLYYSTMKHCRAVVGNSSSGILESPIFKTPAVNIGNRQKGRIMAGNVISVECKTENILQGIYTACSEEFKRKAQITENPFERPNTALSIYNEILRYPDRND